jgi:hypothetical protein
MSHDMHERIHSLEGALREIKQWCEAYPAPVFIPFTEEQIRHTGVLLKEYGIDIGALHGQWARRLLDGIGGIARKALDP